MGAAFEGFDELIQKIEEAEKKVPRAKNKFLAQEAEIIRGNVVRLTPVDTGRLRAGWKRSRAHDSHIEIYNNTEYASHIEWGHRVKVHGKFTGHIVPGRHMLRDGMEEAKETFADDAQDIFEELLS